MPFSVSTSFPFIHFEDYFPINVCWKRWLKLSHCCPLPAPTKTATSTCSFNLCA
jgi:hypothetical protein